MRFAWGRQVEASNGGNWWNSIFPRPFLALFGIVADWQEQHHNSVCILSFSVRQVL